MTLGEILKRFKETETAENIVPLVDSEELRNGVVAWKSVVIEYTDNDECDVQGDAAQWEWMWTKVRFDQAAFALVAGVQTQNVIRLFQRLRGLRLIYPDGSINTIAAQYLQALIMAKLPKPKNTKK